MGTGSSPPPYPQGHPTRPRGWSKPLLAGALPVNQRRLPNDDMAKTLRRIVENGLKAAVEKMQHADDTMDFKKLLMLLALGKFDSPPFDDTIIKSVRDDLRIECKLRGHGDGLPKAGDAIQAFEVRLIQSLLSAFEDPDHYYCEWWAVGTWLGSRDRKLPRAPAIFDRKIKWKRLEPTDEMHQGWQTNYPSRKEHVELVQKQFEAEKLDGMMTTMKVREAIEEFGDSLNIASTAAIGKKGRTDEVRVLYDGTHGLDLNPGIRVRDQVRFPTASDGKSVLFEMGDEGGPHFSLNLDFSKAHRGAPRFGRSGAGKPARSRARQRRLPSEFFDRRPRLRTRCSSRRARGRGSRPDRNRAWPTCRKTFLRRRCDSTQ